MKCVVLAVAMLISAPAVGQLTNVGKGPGDSPPSPQSGGGSPSLSDTLDFINQALKEDSAGSMNEIGNCEVSLFHEHLENIAIPTGGLKKVTGNYQAGIPDKYEPDWAFIDPATHLRSDFNLKDIDPDSIKADKVFSLKAAGNSGDSSNPRLPTPDRSIVMFSTANLTKAIHETDFIDEDTVKNADTDGSGKISFLLEPGTSNRLEKDESSEMLLLENNDLAVRFAKAFKHAVELCGGKPSAF